MRLPAPVGLALLTLVAVGSWWLAQPDDATVAAPAAVPQPGYYVHDADLEQTDSSGRITLRVPANDALQLAVGGDVALTELRVDYLVAPGRDWVMTANDGTLPPNGRTVLLAGDVRLSAPDEGAALVRTEHLQLDVDTELATSADPVRLEMPPNSINAVGLRADLKQDTLQLLALVNGTFTR